MSTTAVPEFMIQDKLIFASDVKRMTSTFVILVFPFPDIPDFASTFPILVTGTKLEFPSSTYFIFLNLQLCCYKNVNNALRIVIKKLQLVSYFL